MAGWPASFVAYFKISLKNPSISGQMGVDEMCMVLGSTVHFQIMNLGLDQSVSFPDHMKNSFYSAKESNLCTCLCSELNFK